MKAQGWGVAKDYAQALSWYRKAAATGNATAMSNLGVMYENGWGVPRNDAQAVIWYRKAVDAGDPSARESLRRLGQ
jgi:uncharacterized protein